MNQGPQNIDAILSGCRKNDRESQKALYMAFYAYAMSICIRYAQDREEAVEILNDGFMNIFSNIKRFDLTRPFKPWLRRILINAAINRFRKNQKLQLEREQLQVNSHEAAEEILSGISYQEIIDMVQKLSPAYRTVFNLYVIEGYKHEEIAEMLNISVGTSKSNLARAKQKLRDLLREYFQEDYERQK